MKIIKKAMAAVTSSVMAATACIISIGSLGTADAANMSAVQLVEDMGQGWNLGNTFDCTNTWTNPLTPQAIESAWGNPVTTRAMIKEIQKSGFNTVRIPITWQQMMSADGTSINAAYVERIKEVLGYVLDSGMYAIINTHHDEDWIKTESNTTKFANLWKCIATAFADYDEHLVFEGTNEVSFSSTAQQQTFNQAFVDTVRATGGNNADRLLLVCAPSNNTEKLLKEFSAPNDPANMIAVSCHYYEPPRFCVADTTSDWGHYETWGTDSDKAALNADFNSLEEKFIKNGIPVIIGEYGVNTSTKGGKEKASIYAFLSEVANNALKREGMCPVVWDMSVDNNGQGDMAYFDRTKLTWYDDNIRKLFVDAAGATTGGDEQNSKLSFTADQLRTVDAEGNTVLRLDLKPYKNSGAQLDTAIVTFTFTQTDPNNTQASGDIAISFNMKADSGEICYSNIDTPINMSSNSTVVDLKPEKFNVAWDANNNVTKTAKGAIEMDYLQFDNWWTWAQSGSATVTIDTVTIIFDGDVTTAPEVTTTTTEVTTTTTTEATTTTTEATTTTTASSSVPAVKVWGDADDNNQLTVSDIVSVLQYSANKEKYPLSEKAIYNCDMNADGDVNAADAYIMQQVDAGVISVENLPVK